MTTSLTPITLFKCLADDTRARLMLLINQEHELCVCELTCALDLSQPKISRHLAQLRQCGLLSDRRAGQWVYYQVDPQLPVWAREIIALAAAAYGQALRDDETRLQGMNERPQRSSLCCHSGD
ncbi:ArsR family transcriptional regulator [Paraperlucidibaca baekdonensis]|uniref:ArsR family transcriptional regulator n=1 Tax=Paraperlucidibaca baekdonensis TaxID=748120 RepID=A0A3E0H1H1_9GAMM|nr:metalloregulator ArsR/SmtB family transcription factor [Paraperlucidibaca baekdonensis]REH36706.1 ArsR family transcriptional regulator [Paraperlucidibaca baekdonensis]